MDNIALKPCPFCGEIPELPCGDGTQYEIECNCGCARSCVQICDLMEDGERASDDFTDYRYKQKYIDRAKDYTIEQWNTRTPIDPEQIMQDNIATHNDRLREKGDE